MAETDRATEATMMIQAPELLTHPAIHHAFFTRQGGMSDGIYTSLNAGHGSGDDQASVAHNRAQMAKEMNTEPNRLVTPHQVHSSVVAIVSEPWGNDRPKADAVVTRERDIAIGVVTADCGPVLFADPDAGIVGAAHAGWKGALNGVLQNTVKAMIDLGANRHNIVAALGPSITQKSYEVGPEFPGVFLQQSGANQHYFTPSKNTGHWMFDLCGYSIDQLKETGIQASFTGQCTYIEEDLFFSYRRTTHRNEPDYGRQLSAIAVVSA